VYLLDCIIYMVDYSLCPQAKPTASVWGISRWNSDASKCVEATTDKAGSQTTIPQAQSAPFLSTYEK